jgi:hypothetical protein
MDYTYDIAGVTYVQRPLVLGQVRQMIAALGEFVIPRGAGVIGVIDALGDRLPHCLAVILTPQGQSPRDKDLERMAAELEFAITIEQTMQAVTDFFTCNPIASLLTLIEEVVGKLSLLGMTPEHGSTSSSAFSPEVVLPTGTVSSGGAVLPIADPT